MLTLCSVSSVAQLCLTLCNPKWRAGLYGGSRWKQKGFSACLGFQTKGAFLHPPAHCSQTVVCIRIIWESLFLKHKSPKSWLQRFRSPRPKAVLKNLPFQRAPV